VKDFLESTGLNMSLFGVLFFCLVLMPVYGLASMIGLLLLLLLGCLLLKYILLCGYYELEVLRLQKVDKAPKEPDHTDRAIECADEAVAKLSRKVRKLKSLLRKADMSVQEKVEFVANLRLKVSVITERLLDLDSQAANQNQETKGNSDCEQRDK
jgi:hypothetical protein